MNNSSNKLFLTEKRKKVTINVFIDKESKYYIENNRNNPNFIILDRDWIIREAYEIELAIKDKRMKAGIYNFYFTHVPQYAYDKHIKAENKWVENEIAKGRGAKHGTFKENLVSWATKQI